MSTAEQKLLRIQEEAQITLKEAMRNERSKRWKRNGCLAGCHSNSCLMTPLFAKRAFAYAKCCNTGFKHSTEEKPSARMRIDPEGFLFSLNVPHTVSSISLVSEAHSRRQTHTTTHHSPQAGSGMAWSTGSVPAATQLSSPDTPPMDTRGPTRPPFRCGTPSRLQRSADSAVRRWQYGMAIRAHSIQQAADPISGHIRALTGDRRSQSAHPLMAATIQPVQPTTAQRRVKTATPFTKGATPMATGLAVPSGASEETIKVFEQVNLDNMPRMYYKPWKGDKLPMTETERRKTAPVFKV
uniref:Uncharacterized protein n=1 Tax=Branchiostoma floridae TaxID=7739 RepID=C3ZIU5_BRAFL|eukprot:XP_002591535.1 hypothetical protein BRAFLDRAFT_92764 [Branchiostoma floridae]